MCIKPGSFRIDCNDVVFIFKVLSTRFVTHNSLLACSEYILSEWILVRCLG